MTRMMTTSVSTHPSQLHEQSLVLVDLVRSRRLPRTTTVTRCVLRRLRVAVELRTELVLLLEDMPLASTEEVRRTSTAPRRTSTVTTRQTSTQVETSMLGMAEEQRPRSTQPTTVARLRLTGAVATCSRALKGSIVGVSRIASAAATTIATCGEMPSAVTAAQ